MQPTDAKITKSIVPKEINDLHMEEALARIRWWNRLVALDTHSMVIVMGAYLDNALEALLRAWLLDHETTDSLLSDSRGLGSFSNKTKLALSLELVDRQMFELLSTFNKIRNHAAHNWEELSLEQSPIREHAVRLGELMGASGAQDRNRLLAVAEVTSTYLGVRAAFIRGKQGNRKPDGERLGLKQCTEMTVEMLNRMYAERQGAEAARTSNDTAASQANGE